MKTPAERIIAVLDADGFLRTERAHTRAVALVAGVLAAIEAETRHESGDRLREGLRAQAQRQRGVAAAAQHNAVRSFVAAFAAPDGEDVSPVVLQAVRELLAAATAERQADQLQDLSNGHG